MRDLDTIDSELRLLVAVRRSIREHGGEPSSRQVEWNDAAPNARLDGINSRSRAGHRCRSNETMCARRRKEDITWLV
jgi:hypothetical protein